MVAYIPLKQSQEWGPTSTPIGITGSFATPPQVITEAWSTPPQGMCRLHPVLQQTKRTFHRRNNLWMNGKHFHTIHEFMNDAIKIGDLANQLTSLLNHKVPRTDCRFIANTLLFSTNGDAQG